MTLRARARWLIGVRVLVAVAVLGGFALLLHSIDLAALGRALRGAAILPIAIAAVLNFVHLGFKAWRWRIMLARVRRVSLARLYRYTIANYAASTLLPARMGELVRVWLLRQREGIAAATASAVALGEKALEVVAMLLLVAPVHFLLPGLPSWVGRSILALSGVGALCLVSGWIALYWIDRHPSSVSGAPSHWIARFGAGVGVWRRPGELALAVAVSLVAWIIDAAEILLVLRALGVMVPWPASLLVLLTLNVAVAIPSTPASVGAFELGAIVALELLGVPRPEALAFALVYHAIQVIPLGLIGVAELRLVSELRQREREPTATATPDPMT